MTILCFFLPASLSAASKLFNPPVPMVALRLTNVRAQTISHNGRYENDPLQETQLEAGEPVTVYEKKGEWFRIEAPEQMEFTHHNRWEGYPGWVEAKDLSADLSKHHRLKISALAGADLRKEILRQAALHLGESYLWGGRSPHDPSNKSLATGVDCSGLVNWSFRQVGWFIPRDAHEQFLRARRIEAADLKPADLIFLAKADKPEKVTHVMFFAGLEEILEAPQSGEKVRHMAAPERLGRPLAGLKNGVTVGDKVIYFGSFFVEEK